MSIRQDIPVGWVESPVRAGELRALRIEYKGIVTGWVWRNRHANPIETLIIKSEDLSRALLCCNYYKRIGY